MILNGLWALDFRERLSHIEVILTENRYYLSPPRIGETEMVPIYQKKFDLYKFSVFTIMKKILQINFSRQKYNGELIFYIN